MGVSIVGTPAAITEGSFYTAEAGADRVVVVSGTGESAFSSRPLVGVTFGGVAMTEAVYTGNDVLPKGGIYYILESQIPSGSNEIVFDWDGQAHQTFQGAIYTLEGVDQSSPVPATDFGNVASGSAIDLTLTSVDNSVLISAAGTNSTATSLSLSSTNTASTQTFNLDAQADSSSHEGSSISSAVATGQAETVGLRFSASSEYAGVAAVFAPASTGPSITDIDTDNTIVPGQTCTVNVENMDLSAQPSLALYDATQTYSVPVTVNSYSDVNQTINVTIPDPALDYATDHVLGVTPSGGTETTLTGVTLQPVSGNAYVELTSIASSGSIGDYIDAGESSGTLEVGDQIEWTNDANATVNADSTFTYSQQFQVRAWDATDNTMGPFATVEVPAPQGTVTIDSVSVTADEATVNISYSETDQDSFEYRLDGGTAVDVGNNTSFTIAGLADATYSIEVRAVNAGGTSTWSASDSFTVDTSVPAFNRALALGALGPFPISKPLGEPL